MGIGGYFLNLSFLNCEWEQVKSSMVIDLTWGNAWKCLIGGKIWLLAIVIFREDMWAANQLPTSSEHCYWTKTKSKLCGLEQTLLESFFFHAVKIFEELKPIFQKLFGHLIIHILSFSYIFPLSYLQQTGVSNVIKECSCPSMISFLPFTISSLNSNVQIGR